MKKKQNRTIKFYLYKEEKERKSTQIWFYSHFSICYVPWASFPHVLISKVNYYKNSFLAFSNLFLNNSLQFKCLICIVFTKIMEMKTKFDFDLVNTYSLFIQKKKFLVVFLFKLIVLICFIQWIVCLCVCVYKLC